MKLHQVPALVGWIVRDTFLQAIAGRVFWLVLALNGLIILACAGFRLEGPRSLTPPGEIELYGGDNKPLTGPNPRPSRMSLGFGLLGVGQFRDVESQVHFLQVMLARWAVGAGGILLLLVSTAGLLPESLRPESASVLLAKPVPRWLFLSGKVTGVLVVAAVQAGVFVLGTWAALGLRSGVWPARYLWALPLALVHFLFVYGATALLAVTTRRTAACLFGSLVFWAICAGVNYGRHSFVAFSSNTVVARPTRWLVEAVYWALPKPADLVYLLDTLLAARDHLMPVPVYDTVQAAGALHPTLAVLTSLLAALVLFLIAAREFAAADY